MTSRRDWQLRTGHYPVVLRRPGALQGRLPLRSRHVRLVMVANDLPALTDL